MNDGETNCCMKVEWPVSLVCYVIPASDKDDGCCMLCSLYSNPRPPQPGAGRLSWATTALQNTTAWPSVLVLHGHCRTPQPRASRLCWATIGRGRPSVLGHHRLGPTVCAGPPEPGAMLGHDGPVCCYARLVSLTLLQHRPLSIASNTHHVCHANAIRFHSTTSTILQQRYSISTLRLVLFVYYIQRNL